MSTPTPMMLPSRREILAGLKPRHPRLLICPDRFEQIKQGRRQDARLDAWCKALSRRAHELTGQPPIAFDNQGPAKTRHFLERLMLLTIVYRLEGGDELLEQVYRDLDDITQLNPWPHNLRIGFDLSTSEVSTAVALVYDWLYDVFEAPRREAVGQALVHQSLEYVLELYRREIGLRYWPERNNNWNQVCNGGAILAALAVGDLAPDPAGEVLEHALKSLPKAMNEFAPDGGWEEGPMYWRYATLWNCLLLDALDTALGTDFGLSQVTGFDQSGWFYMHSYGPSGLNFNFSDSSTPRLPAPQLLWLAGRFHEPAFAGFELETIQFDKPGYPKPTTHEHGHEGLNLHMLDVIWSDRVSDWGREVQRPKDAHFRKCEMVTLRSSWEDPNATFIGFKGGTARRSHSHMDAGSFVLEALGERWAIDLGSENYSVPGYFEAWAGSQMRHFSYYRIRPEGHNTLVIDSHVNPQQVIDAHAPMLRTRLNADDPFAIADLTEVYGGRVAQAWRGVRLLNNRKVVLLQDQVATNQPIDLWWFLHTRARIDLAGDGRCATLVQNGRKMSVHLLSPAEGRLERMDARPLFNSPDPEQDPNEGITKLAVHLEVAQNPLLAVCFVPEGLSADLPEIVPLASW